MSSENNEDSFKQHVNSSITIFTVITFIFFTIKGLCVYHGAIEAYNKNKTAFTFLLVSWFFLFSLHTNISATQEQIICGERNYKIALYATVIPFILIYSTGIFLITIFPGWTRCFSNTFGSAGKSLGKLG